MGESLPLALWNLAGSNRRRYGGYIIHLGVVLMAIGIIGIEIFQTETQGTIPVGGQLSLGQYSDHVTTPWRIGTRRMGGISPGRWSACTKMENRLANCIHAGITITNHSSR